MANWRWCDSVLGSGRTTLLGPSLSRVEFAEPVNADTVAYYVLRTRRTSYHRRTLVLPPSVPRSTPWPLASTQDKPGREPLHTRARIGKVDTRDWTPDAGLGLGIFPENLNRAASGR